MAKKPRKHPAKEARKTKAVLEAEKKALRPMWDTLLNAGACKGSGARVPYYEVQGGRAPCPKCQRKVQALDDRDGSVFTLVEHNP